MVMTSSEIPLSQIFVSKITCISKIVHYDVVGVLARSERGRIYEGGEIIEYLGINLHRVHNIFRPHVKELEKKRTWSNTSL